MSYYIRAKHESGSWVYLVNDILKTGGAMGLHFDIMDAFVFTTSKDAMKTVEALNNSSPRLLYTIGVRKPFTMVTAESIGGAVPDALKRFVT